MADNYWKGEASSKPNWEIVAEGAAITGYVDENPLKVRVSEFEGMLPSGFGQSDPEKAEDG